MKTRYAFTLALAIGMGILLEPLGVSAQSQGSGAGNGGPPAGKGRPAIDQRPELIGRDSAADSDAGQNSKLNAPSRPGNQTSSPAVQDLVAGFQSAREQYLGQQKALALQYQSASAAQRQAIRDQLKSQLDRLKEQQLQLQREARDRAMDLKRQLNPDLGRLIDRGTDEARTR